MTEDHYLRGDYLGEILSNSDVATTEMMHMSDLRTRPVSNTINRGLAVKPQIARQMSAVARIGGRGSEPSALIRN